METWESLSEICVGLILNGRISADIVRPQLFQEPYGRAIELLQDGKPLETLIGTVGLTPVQAAQHAAAHVNGIAADSFVRMLETAHLREALADRLDRTVKDLRRGKEVNTSKVVSDLHLLDGERKDVLERMSDIVPETDVFMPCGWPALDEHLMGIPKTGLIVVGGAPGGGKTSYMSKKAAKFVKTYRDKKAIVFTLEMMKGEYVKRAAELEKLKKSEQDRILICDEIMDVDEIQQLVCTYPDVGWVGIDFADLMIKDETTESEMAHIYRVCQNLAKHLQIPVELLSQLSRTYQGGIPRPYNLRYTSMAESLAWQILMVYNPHTDFHAGTDEGKLPAVEGMGYLINWKTRGGFKYFKPIAIQIPWNGRRGWSDHANEESGSGIFNIS